MARELTVRSVQDFLRDIGSVRRNVRPPREDTVTFVEMAVAEMDQKWCELLAEGGWNVVVIDKCSDYYGGVKPDTDDSPHDYATVGGLCVFGHRILLISDQLNSNLFGAPDRMSVFHTVQHECAHALDKMVGEGGRRLYSASNVYRDALAKDRTKISADGWKELWWLQNENEVGVGREIFANIVAIDSSRGIDSPRIEAMFPLATAVVKKRLAEFGIVLPADRKYEAYGSLVQIGKNLCLSAFQKIKID